MCVQRAQAGLLDLASLKPRRLAAEASAAATPAVAAPAAVTAEPQQPSAPAGPQRLPLWERPAWLADPGAVRRTEQAPEGGTVARDFRRRRQSYRAKRTHVTKRTPTQVRGSPQLSPVPPRTLLTAAALRCRPCATLLAT